MCGGALEEANVFSAKNCGHKHREGACRSSLVLSEPGKMVDADNWCSRVWNRAVKKSVIDPISIHELRYTYASRLVQAGIPMTEIGRLLGH